MFKFIYFAMCVIGILYGANAIYTRSIRVTFRPAIEPGRPFTVTGTPAVVLGAAAIAMSLYAIKEHVL
ncbi:hypothetical protein [Lysobacter niastensis]|uniref:Uncharacterized protein n=1 Tax=Lysobacter niastensis TaxID=380629 RepID=A0ABS0B6X8_9GAMM|nr:hypothetical protein [Lysobacter niastensis]MBF6024003.1 hypothetical protein [Lysobacter niastensis]